MSERIDDLLERTLAEGAVPADASEAERVEIERLRAAATRLSSNRAAVRAEAEASMPTARARFERFVAERQGVEQARRSPGRTSSGGFFAWLAGGGLRTYAAATAVLAIVVVGALVAPALLNDVETASAQVLTPGDYVEFEAVAGDTVDGAMDVSAEFGEVEVVVDGQTHVVDATGAGPAELAPGRTIVIAGVVDQDRRVRARTVAISDLPVERPDARRVELLQDLRNHVEGRIVAISYTEDGQPRVVLAVRGGNLLVVRVNAELLDALLARIDTPVGAVVRVVRGDDLPAGMFGLEVVDGPDTTPGPGDGDKPMLLRFSGIVTAREGLVVTVESERRGPVQVRLTRDTQFRIGDPRVITDEARGERIINRFVTVQAVPDPEQAGGLIAITVLVGREAPPRGN